MKFDPSKAEGTEIVVQIDLSGPNGGVWDIAIDNRRLVNGQLAGERAYMTGRLERDLDRVLKLRDLGIV